MSTQEMINILKLSLEYMRHGTNCNFIKSWGQCGSKCDCGYEDAEQEILKTIRLLKDSLNA